MDVEEYSLSGVEIAQLFWKTPQSVPLEPDAINRVNRILRYLHGLGFELIGIPADGDCLLSSFLGSYKESLLDIPLLNNLTCAALRMLLCSNEKLSEDKRKFLGHGKNWISWVDDEGGYLGRLFNIPVRIVTGEVEISDMVQFPGDEKGTMDWDAIETDDRPEEGKYLFLVDLGQHFCYAKFLGGSSPFGLNLVQNESNVEMNTKSGIICPLSFDDLKNAQVGPLLDEFWKCRKCNRLVADHSLTGNALKEVPPVVTAQNFFSFLPPSNRAEFSLPRPAMKLTDDIFGQCLGRDNSVIIFLKYLFRRWSDLPAFDALGDEERRKINRLLATMCAPGGGKSYFFDFLSTIPGWRDKKLLKFLRRMKDDKHVDVAQVDESKFPEFLLWLRNTIFLPISFNGSTPMVSSYSWKIEFCARLCYAYLFDKSQAAIFKQFVFSFGKFVTTSYPEDQLIHLVVESMLHNETRIPGRDPKKVNFVIMVDEVSKLGLPEKEFDLLMNLIGTIIDQSSSLGPCFSVIMSSLEVTSLKNRVLTKSKRAIGFIPLPSPGIKVAISLFENEVDFDANVDLFTVIWMSSCHWRTLKAIKKNLHSFQDMKFSSIVDIVLKESLSGNFPDDFGEKCIVQAILASPVQWDTVLQCGQSFESCVSQGYFINSTTDQDNRAIPIVSVLMVQAWATNLFASNHLALLLKEMFKLDCSRGDPFTYEIFHCYWEAIRYYSLVYSHDIASPFRLLKISNLYNYLGQKKKNFVDKLVRVRKVMKFNSDYSYFEDFVTAFALEKVKKLPSKQKDALLGQIFHFGGNNPGFDSLIVFEDESLNIVLLLISSKYSSGDAYQEIDELFDGHEKSMNSVKTHWPAQDCAKVYFVANCWRNNRAHRNIPANSIILEKSELKELYGSLSQRPQLGFKFVEPSTLEGEVILNEQDIQSLKKKDPELPEREDPSKKRKITKD